MITTTHDCGPASWIKKLLVLQQQLLSTLVVQNLISFLMSGKASEFPPPFPSGWQAEMCIFPRGGIQENEMK